MWFGQLIIGPPGSGKSTYVAGVEHILKQINRKLVLINLDPFVENDVYKADVNISELVDIKKVFCDLGLGPNGTLIYCMEYLLMNFDWLEEKLNEHKDHYLLIDTPGQVELYTHNDALRKIVQKMTKINCRLTSVHIVDSTLCSDNYKYVSALLLSLCSQIHLELPHVNVFSKIDLLKYFKDDLNFPLSYYVQAQNLEQLMLYARYQNESSSDSEMGDSPKNSSNDKNHCAQGSIKQVIQDEINTGNIRNARKNYRRFSNKYLKLNEYICETVEDYNIINFALLDIQDKYSVLKLLKIIDGANGFRFSSIYSEYSLFDTYVEAIEYDCDDIQEKIVDVSDEEKFASQSAHPPNG
ncbi:XPA binding protein 1, putative [Plasmodium knowlesi strain H]|uniref:GPN-loop GTPase 2 n=3 Tax=Plasmodium knowlesi TaxID=5850 RepID=A0A5K1UKM3_PLAKH|nr:GPN-loop GTPase, putative [Plasmodium knowlesi strain H]OTN67442.1 putative ATP binding protein [Plasmodium knowlesi]CAA9987448.1 GPN-loop GTPase, putative [Plasmodium knowlesi strain H]SBO23242.1 XPA binding protein 1, putative [Plasmodium knowlesi strain H]SBO24108.1 XPA binding protein 1, putative [Plasmodium knowlesi strain H]VVS76922.1 GPN-loop GTPase, putative [Plasmodium knowlesi strain H]|eukprot:XP_002258449.1 ATP binding protein, putative [Plasmodium knowlesi strain H]